MSEALNSSGDVAVLQARVNEFQAGMAALEHENKRLRGERDLERSSAICSGSEAARHHSGADTSDPP